MTLKRRDLGAKPLRFIVLFGWATEGLSFGIPGPRGSDYPIATRILTPPGRGLAHQQECPALADEVEGARHGETLILVRVLQGAGAGIIMPLSLTILTAAFPPERRGAMVGI